MSASRRRLEPNSHDGKALAHILDNFPRDELFQIGEDELFATAMGVLRLGERPKVRVFVRFDRFDRFVSAARVCAARPLRHGSPREDSRDPRQGVRRPRIRGDAHHRRFHARPRALHRRAATRGRDRKSISACLKADIRAAIRTWEDGFADALMKEHGEADGMRLYHRHTDAFPARYRDAFSAEEAVRDLDEFDRCCAAKISGHQGARLSAGARSACRAAGSSFTCWARCCRFRRRCRCSKTSASR